jgi:glutamine synthetase adenylyltransferase
MFIDELSQLASASASLVHMSYADPETLNSFLALLGWDALERVQNLTRRKPILPELLQHHDQLLALINVHYQSSHFFKRHFHRILDKYPVFVKNLHNNEKIKEMANGFYGDLTALASLDERFERLGDYYDMEFVRVSLMAMAGAGCAQTDAEFIEFCDNYTQTLYEFCLQDVHLSLGYAMHFHDRFALYAAGGLAREQGFDDDYDMIVILDSNNRDEIDYCNKIVAKMNSHILKRGILPHHRFAEHFDSYVASLDQLAEYLSTGTEDVFVDQSQILSSRMLVGSGKLEEELQRKIIVPCIFEREQEYIAFMLEEMKSRHELSDSGPRNNIKECRGGLRDIEMLLLICKARHKVRDPLTRKFLRRLVEIDPAHGEQYAYIERHLNFLKNLRDLYRLKVAACDDIEQEHLGPVAESTGYGSDGSGRLYSDFIEKTDQAATVIMDLMAGIVP